MGFEGIENFYGAVFDGRFRRLVAEAGRGKEPGRAPSAVEAPRYSDRGAAKGDMGNGRLPANQLLDIGLAG